MRKGIKLVCISVCICLLLITCTGYSEQSTPENTLSKMGGTPVNFEDPAMRACIADQLGISSDDVITDKMCESIQSIDTSGYVLTTLADLELFPNLTKLYVDNSYVTYGRRTYNSIHLKGLNKIPNVVSITLKDCGVNELDRLANLSHLEYLDISNTVGYGGEIIDYSPLANLTTLKHLNLTNHRRLKDTSFLTSLTNLEELIIADNVSSIDEYHLEKLTKLKRLSICNCYVDEILQQLSASGSLDKLEYLDIIDSEYRYVNGNDVYVTEAELRTLSTAKNLKELHIKIAGLTTIEGFGNLQNLEILYIDNFESKLALSEYSHLSKLKKLTELSLSDRPNRNEEVCTPNDYSFLNNIPSLVTLSIASYDGMGIDCFSGLGKLENLQVGRESWYDGIYGPTIDISGIEKLKSLKWFKYGGRLKSSAPLDELDDLVVEEFE